jgi:membrane fusion protein (multidrug efflux system)
VTVPRLILLGGLICVASIAGAAYWWFFLRDKVTTDNAYVVADSARISARVPGTVIRVHVENDQPVERGQALLELDPRDYEVALEQARATVARVEAEILAAEASLAMVDSQTAAQLQAARTVPPETMHKRREAQHRLDELLKRRQALVAELREAQRDFQRFDSLYRTKTVPERQWEQAATTLEKAKAQLEALDAETSAVRASLNAIDKVIDRSQAQLEAVQSDRAMVEVQRHKLAALKAQLDEARAAVRAAQLNLSYCTVTAPLAGYIVQKSVQVGERVQPGQPLMGVVPLEEAYVEANFKETQLEKVRLGQPATVRADIYPDHPFTGKVVGIRAGTGAAFSLLPPENATGNWIKVVQRVPVKIRLDTPPPPEYPLRVGLSLKVVIHTRDQSGPRLIAGRNGA